jgi:hypothetical protein
MAIFENGMNPQLEQLQAFSSQPGLVYFPLCASIARPAVKGGVDNTMHAPRN